MAGHRKAQQERTGQLPVKQRRKRADGRWAKYQTDYANAGDAVQQLGAAYDYLRAVLRSIPPQWATPLAREATKRLEDLARQTDEENVKRR